MTRTIRLNTAVPDAYKALLAFNEEAEKATAEAGLGSLIPELVRIRASQINGCAFCLRMHVRDALEKGEATDRIAVISAWRETRYFAPEERAALALTESITLISTPGNVPDSDFEALDDAQVAAVRWLAVVINAFNRVAISSHYDVRP